MSMDLGASRTTLGTSQTDTTTLGTSELCVPPFGDTLGTTQCHPNSFSPLLFTRNEFPENISTAAEGLKSITLIPALGEPHLPL